MKFVDSALCRSMTSLSAEASGEGFDCLIIVCPFGNPHAAGEMINGTEMLISAALMVQANIRWLTRLRWLLFGVK